MHIVCVSHLRWDFVFQRPQQLLSRATKKGRVLYVEEPVTVEGESRMDVQISASGVRVAVPHLSAALPPDARIATQRQLLAQAIRTHIPGEYVLWYYTPMALEFTEELKPVVTVYDCMDELSAFAGAPPELQTREEHLFRKADIVFTGGQSLYEAKRGRHHNVQVFPSSVDVAHFARARAATSDPSDQAAIPRPRIGFFGVIDERMDYPLLNGIARARPEWQLILIGPTAKVDRASLPQGQNVHYLGPKPYAELPAYIAGWDVAMLPFARNESTRFISPTKTPEYLAAGKPVVSTSIRDVVRPYGQQGLARIADDVPSFIAAIEAALKDNAAERLRAADAFLTHMSWDGTWLRMHQTIEQTAAAKSARGASAALNAS